MGGGGGGGGVRECMMPLLSNLLVVKLSRGWQDQPREAKSVRGSEPMQPIRPCSSDAL